ncbi:hypothetical protein AB0C34_29645 [Nocardia sp. NPDC049220]|uniref:hypothetical protein n=1 Tax=Nocardia sp. NPDC049220 TaxID=3155273 RepID=UPI0033DC2ECE
MKTNRQRAAELAAEAEQALQDVQRGVGDGSSGFLRDRGAEASAARWARVRALQAQAQVFATLAVVDELSSGRPRGTSRGNSG